MERAVTIDHEADLLAPADHVRACLLDPANLARCVPGARLTDTDGTSLWGRIRLKLSAVPVQYAIEAQTPQLDAATEAVALDGCAEDRRSGHSTGIRMRVSITNMGPEHTRCRIFGELTPGLGEAPRDSSPHAVAERLLPQFTRRLEELASEHSELGEAEGSGDAAENLGQPARSEAPRGLLCQVARGSALVSGGVAAGRAVGRHILRRVRSVTARPWRVPDRRSGYRLDYQEGPAMQLENTFTVPAPIDEAWELLLTPERVATCIPGATLESVDGDDLKGRVRVKLGPMAMQYRGTARFVERDDSAHAVVVDASGKESSGAGGVKAQMRMSLAEVAEGTQCSVITDLAITGKAAQFGRGVMADVSAKLIDQFAARLAHEVNDGATTAATGEVGAPTEQAAEDEDTIDLLGTVGRKQVVLATVPVVAAAVLVGWLVVRRVRSRRK